MNNEPVAVFVPAPLRHDEWKRRFTLNWIDEEPTVITHLYSEVLVRQQQAEIEKYKIAVFAMECFRNALETSVRRTALESVWEALDNLEEK